MTNINQPIFILPDDSKRFSGRDALGINILAARTLANIVRTTLGPKGMDKMLNDSLGDIVVTNDGATILREMEIAQPAARMLVEIAKKQEDVVGDGTTTAVIIAGELLIKAQELVEDGMPVPLIIKGFRQAKEKALEFAYDYAFDARDEDTLKSVAMTALTGKGSDYAKKLLADLIVEAALRVEEDGKINKESINIQRVNGGSVEDSFIADGLIVDKAPMSKDMYHDVTDAKIAVLKYPIEVKDIDNAKIDYVSSDQIQAFLDNEQEMIKDLTDKIIDSGANVLFCQKGIDEMAEHYLRKAGIMCYKRVRNTDIKRIVKATGAKYITNINDLTSDMLGSAGHVYIKKIFDHEITFLDDCKDAKAASIILRGSTRHVTEQIKRALDDALGVVITNIEEGKVVIGGGAFEIDLIKKLRAYSETIKGKEQLAILAYANSLEVIPRTLAENAGLDTVQIISDLKAANEKSKFMGINVFSGEVIDMKEFGVIEPLKVKTHAINSAAEAAEMILRIDDMVAAKGGFESTGPDESGNDDSGMPPAPGAGGMPPAPGAGGMPPMM